MVTIRNTGRPLSELDIKNFERRLGCCLPKAYRRFLLENNGGRPPLGANGIIIEHLPGGETDVGDFFGIDRPIKSSTIDWNLDMFRGRISNQLLPIACDSGGNLFCISLSEQDYGSVVYCDFDPGFGCHVSNSAIYYPVAPEFDSFLEKIGSLEDN
jgi:hypothetical protein